MGLKVLIALSLLGIATALPGKLLRVPKIYNALITTKEKLLPSEAYPATTGPIFQPIALTGEPVLLNANDFVRSASQQEAWRKGARGGGGVEDADKSGDAPGKQPPTPLVFYPRYGVYYPHHTVISYVNTLQHSFVYTAVDHSKSGYKAPQQQQPQPQPPPPQVDRSGTAEEYPDESSYSQADGNFARNGYGRIGVPDVPPPPPPSTYLTGDRRKDKEVR